MILRAKSPLCFVPLPLTSTGSMPLQQLKIKNMAKKKVLFLCTGNSCRSQMAQGWAKHLKGSKYQFYSAGIQKHGMNPNAVKVMQEVGINIAQTQHSKLLSQLKDVQFDYVITVCDHAHQGCPMVPPTTKVIQKSFEDPPKKALQYQSESEKLECYRKVRDQIREFVTKIQEYVE